MLHKYTSVLFIIVAFYISKTPQEPRIEIYCPKQYSPPETPKHTPTNSSFLTVRREVIPEYFTPLFNCSSVVAVNFKTISLRTLIFAPVESIRN